MADQLGLSVSGYGKIERSDSDINLSRITQIAEILNVSRSVLLEFNSDEVLNTLNAESEKNNEKTSTKAPQAVSRMTGDSDDMSTLLDIIRSLKEENRLLKNKLKKYEPDNDWL